MSLSGRAAQFSPFAALSGYDDLIRETGRLTEPMKELSEDDRELLDRKLRLISEAVSSGRHPGVCLTCFFPDEKKEGGAVRKVTGKVKKVDFFRRAIVLQETEDFPDAAGSGNAAGSLSVREIPIGRILDITGSLADRAGDPPVEDP